MGGSVDPYAVLRGHQSDVQALTFDHSEAHLITGDAQGEVRVWNLTDLRPHSISRLHPASAGILNLKLWRAGPETTLLITQGRDGVTQIWTLASDLALPSERSTPLQSFVRDSFSFCRFSLLAAESEDAPIADATAQQREKKEEEEAFVNSALMPDSDEKHSENSSSTTIGTTTKNIKKCTTTTTAVQAAISSIHHCTKASPAFPAALLAIPGSSEKQIEVCCTACGATVALFFQDPSLASTTTTKSTTKNDEAAAAQLDSWGMCMAVKLFQDAQGKILLAVGYEGGHVVIWSIPVEKERNRNFLKPLALGKLHSEPIMALEIDGLGTTGVSGSAEDKLIAFTIDYSSGVVAALSSIDVRKEGVADVAVRGDGKLLASAGWDGKVRVYKRATGKALAVLKYHSQAASAVAFSPQTHVLASGARDGTVALWDVYATPNNL